MCFVRCVESPSSDDSLSDWTAVTTPRSEIVAFYSRKSGWRQTNVCTGVLQAGQKRPVLVSRNSIENVYLD